MTKRLCRLLRFLYQNTVVQAEQTQAHGPLPCSLYLRLTTNRCPLWRRGSHGTRMTLGKRPAQALDVDLQSASGNPNVRDTQGTVSRGYCLHADTIPYTAESSLHGKKLRLEEEAGCCKSQAPSCRAETSALQFERH